MAAWKKKDKGLSSKEKSVPLHTWIVLITLTFIAFLVFVAVNLFVVDTVIIENNELYGASTIKDAVLNDDMSWNTLYVYLKFKFTETDDIPYVDAVDVQIEDPTTLVITVYEKSILGKIYLDRKKQYIYFDTDGIVTEISDREIEGVPEIKGLECEKATLYQPLSVNSASLHDLLLLTTTLKRSDMIPDTILYGGSNGPILQYSTDIEVVVGTSDYLTQKIERMAAILPMITLKGTLHLENWTEETTDIIFDKGVLASESIKETVQPSDSVTKESSGESEENSSQDNTDAAGQEDAGNEDTDLPADQTTDSYDETNGMDNTGTDNTGEAVNGNLSQDQ